MASETDLCNEALSLIGANIITGIDDGSINANHCARFYPTLRRSLLRSGSWNFAKQRVQLAMDAQAPVFQYAFAYTLPADYVKLVEYNGANLDPTTLALFQFRALYKVENHKILTNDAVVLIVYIRDVTNPNDMDGLFYELISTWLASKLANAIQKDSRRADDLLSTCMKLLLPMAAAVGGQEGSVEPFIVDDLTWGR